MNESYVRGFERWTAGPAQRRAALSAELAEHLRAAESAGELRSTRERLGSPRDAARAFAAGHDLHPAPLGRRIAALVIDVAAPTLAAVLMIAIATAAGIGNGTRELTDFAQDLAAKRSSEWGALQMVAVLSFGLAWLWWIAGLAVTEWRYGRTPGKALMGLRVVSEDGIAISFGQALVRNLTRVFSGPLQIIDWGWALFDARRQRAVDKVAHTLVVRDGTPEPRLSFATPGSVSEAAR